MKFRWNQDFWKSEGKSWALFNKRASKPKQSTSVTQFSLKILWAIQNISWLLKIFPNYLQTMPRFAFSPILNSWLRRIRNFSLTKRTMHHLLNFWYKIVKAMFNLETVFNILSLARPGHVTQLVTMFNKHI